MKIWSFQHLTVLSLKFKDSIIKHGFSHSEIYKLRSELSLIFPLVKFNLIDSKLIYIEDVGTILCSLSVDAKDNNYHIQSLITNENIQFDNFTSMLNYIQSDAFKKFIPLYDDNLTDDIVFKNALSEDKHYDGKDIYDNPTLVSQLERRGFKFDPALKIYINHAKKQFIVSEYNKFTCYYVFNKKLLQVVCYSEQTLIKLITPSEYGSIDSTINNIKNIQQTIIDTSVTLNSIKFQLYENAYPNIIYKSPDGNHKLIFVIDNVQFSNNNFEYYINYNNTWQEHKKFSSVDEFIKYYKSYINHVDENYKRVNTLTYKSIIKSMI